MVDENTIERVALAIEATMFAPHELPLSAELHAKYLETARVAAEAGSMAAGWRPLETAPKDGTIFLVFDKAKGWVSQCQWAQWDAAHSFWVSVDWSSDEYPGNGPIEPTHWMPLPPPPKDTKSAQKSTAPNT